MGRARTRVLDRVDLALQEVAVTVGVVRAGFLIGRSSRRGRVVEECTEHDQSQGNCERYQDG